MKYAITSLILVVGALSSTGQTYRLRKGTIYSTSPGVSQYTVTQYKFTRSNVKGHVKVAANKGHLVISQVSWNPVDLPASSTKTVNKNLTDFRNILRIGDYYVPDQDGMSPTDLKYTMSKWGWFVGTISVKMRKQLRSFINNGTQDSFPRTIQTGISPAFAYGLTKVYHNYKANGEESTFALGYGWFGSFGTIGLSSSNTRDKVYRHSRTALSLSPGAYANIGINKLDLGAVVGWEWATGPGSRSWVYQGQPYFGLIFGYDLWKIRG